tara:strand:+ start:22 stop:135 length:114 start_codon:yes stop_codon:yes gene_type:complete
LLVEAAEVVTLVEEVELVDIDFQMEQHQDVILLDQHL